MRTDVLTDPKVQELLSRNFVCAWTDLRMEATAGGSWRHEPGTDAPECATADGEHNTQLCVLAADGRLLHIRAGFVGADDLARDLAWTLETLRPVAEDDALPTAKQALQLRALVDARISSSKNRNERLDAAFLRAHIGDSWETLDVSDLVDGRGFGDHFFGKHSADPASGTLGAASPEKAAELDAQRAAPRGSSRRPRPGPPEPDPSLAREADASE